MWDCTKSKRNKIGLLTSGVVVLMYMWYGRAYNTSPISGILISSDQMSADYPHFRLSPIFMCVQ